MKTVDKNTSVFPQGDLSHAEAQRRRAGVPRAVAATIDRKPWKRVRLGDVLKNVGWCNSSQQQSKQVRQITQGDDAGAILTTSDFYHPTYPVILFGDHTCNVKYIDFDCLILGDGVKLLAPKREVFSIRFLYYLVQHMACKVPQGYARHLAALKTLECSLPCYEDQLKIATAITSCDTHISALESLIAKYEAIKKATVNLLLRPNEDWRRVKLGEAFTFGNGYTPSKAVKEYWENGTIPWFRMEDIRSHGRILKDAIQHITPQAVKGTGLFPAGSFILSTTATLGEYALLIADSLANQQFTFLIKNVNRANQIDTMWFLQYLALIGEWCRKSANAGGLLAVNMTDLYNYEIPIPPLPEQKRIVTILDSIDGTVSGLKSQLSKSQDIKQGMMSRFFG